jgi:hypothetical protein
MQRRTDYCPTCGGGEPPPGGEGSDQGGSGGEQTQGGGGGGQRTDEQGQGGGGQGGEQTDQQGDGQGGGGGQPGDQQEQGGSGGHGHDHSDGIFDGDSACGGGSGSGGDSIEGELGDPDDVGDGGLSPAEADVIRGQIARDIVSAGKDIGSGYGGLYEWADQFLKPKVDWKRMMKRQISRAVDRAVGAKRATWSEADRRSQPGRRPRVLKPGYYDPKLRVAVVIDTSGSMSGEDISQALGEVQGILKSRSISQDAVTVLTVSTRVAEIKKVTDASQISVMDRGGTDMRIGIDAAEELPQRPDLTIVLTDGYTPWPSEKPKRMQVVAGIIGAREDEDSKVLGERFSIPKFINSVGIPKNEQ